MTAQAIVLMCGPRHEKFEANGTMLCTAWHRGTLCFHRLDHARRLARAADSLMLVGAPYGQAEDADAYVEHARAYGIFAKSCAGTGRGSQVDPTEDWIQSVVEAIRTSSVPLQGFTVVTDDWHLPRAYLLALREAKGAHPRLTVDFEYCRMAWHPPDETMLREQELTKALLAAPVRTG